MQYPAVASGVGRHGASDGIEILNPLIAYTANILQDGSVAPIPRPAPTGKSKGTGHDKPKPSL